MLSVQSVNSFSPAFKRRNDMDVQYEIIDDNVSLAKLDDIEQRLATKYTHDKSKKTPIIISALTLSAIGAVASNKLTKVAVDNAFVKAVAAKGKTLAGKAASKLPEGIKSKHLPKIENIKSEKVKAALNFVKTQITAFAKMGNKDDSVAKGFVKNAITAGGAVFGFVKGLKDENKNGVADIQEAVTQTGNTISLFGDIAAVLS